MSSPALRLQTGAAPPPEGFTPNFDHPTDVLRTINYVTQGLSLVFVTLFMFLKYYAKVTVLHGMWKSEDCMIYTYRFPGTLTGSLLVFLFIDETHMSVRRIRKTDDICEI